MHETCWGHLWFTIPTRLDNSWVYPTTRNVYDVMPTIGPHTLLGRVGQIVT